MATETSKQTSAQASARTSSGTSSGTRSETEPAPVISTDPRTGQSLQVLPAETTRQQVDTACRAAAAAAPALAAMGRAGRAVLLQRLADALEERREDVVATADRETALGSGRLNGELTRTCYQLRLFAQVLQEGSYLEVAIDHPEQTPMGPRPDLRRTLVPLGPVAVFGASNFPLAFSVPGGDTASALAAGCPVVVKAHGAHPATSQLCFDVLTEAARAAGAPEGSIAIVHGLQAGAALVAHPAITAVGFTGSAGGGRALVGIIEQRPDPIPFFGELASLNPLVVTPAAAAERAEQVGAGIVGSFTLGGGQFCTKPGLVLVPDDPGGDRLLAAMAEAVRVTEPQVLLHEGIARSYADFSDRIAASPGVQEVARGGEHTGPGAWAVPRLFTTAAADLSEQLTEECFGPVTVVVRYQQRAQLLEVLDALPASLTATVHRGHDEVDLPREVLHHLRDKAGRFLFDAYPTGVAVSWAQHHGGPWPSTNSQHTSVGTSAIRRFLRPVAYQDVPEDLLPVELREDTSTLPRRVDGALQLPRTPA